MTDKRLTDKFRQSRFANSQSGTFARLAAGATQALQKSLPFANAPWQTWINFK